MAVGDIVRFNVIGAMFGSRVIWGHHFRFLTTAASLQGLSDDFQTNIAPSMLDAITQDVGIMGFEVSDVRVDGPESLFDPVSGSVVGELVSPSLPPQDACCASVHTGFKGRRRRGRFYIPGMSSTLGAGGELASLQRGPIEGYLTVLKNRFCGAGGTPSPDYRMCVYSPAAPEFVDKNGVHTRLTTVITDATNITYDVIVRSQRRRQKGVGE